MVKTRIRTYLNDGDAVPIPETFDEKCGRWLGDFTEFDKAQRYTPSGRPWVDITCGDECPHCDSTAGGGACSFFHREKPKDVIAVCFNDALRIDPKMVNQISINGGNDK